MVLDISQVRFNSAMALSMNISRFVSRIRSTQCRQSSVSSLRLRMGVASSRSMSSFSLEMLKGLRAQTGAPVVECKKALQETNNDLQAAMDWLRKHGAAKASSKVQGRETLEGLIGLTISGDGKSAALVKLASETDFAGRSTKFAELVMNVANATLNVSQTGSLDQDVILNTPAVQDKLVKDLLDETILAIRENLSVSSVVKLSTERGIFVGYVHNKVDSSNHAGASAAVVEVESDGKVDLDTLNMIGKKLAMHVVAARPQYLTAKDVPADIVAKEKELLSSQTEHNGKPPEVVAKIVEGRLRKFYEGICLTEQAHMIEEKNPKVSKVLADHGIKVNSFEAFFIA